MSRPEVSVLLTSWNTLEDTRRCLASLHDTAADVSYEVIAVDNASWDGSAELLLADPRVRLISNDHNVGFAGAMNQAYREARAELILLLNSDVTFHDDTMQTMLAFLVDHPDAVGVSPLYLNPDGTFQQHYVQLPSFAACLALWTALKRVPGFRGALRRFQMQGADFSEPRELASASCMLMRSKVLPVDHIFDEMFPVYWNDAVLTRELEAAGHRMWMIPDAVVTHNRGASCRLLGPAMRFRHLLGGLVRYLHLTQPRHRVVLFRFVLVADYLLKSLVGRTTTLAWGDLNAALRGDVGPLPDGDTRAWEIVGGRGRLGTGEQGDNPAAGAAGWAGADGAVRTLSIDPPGSRRGRRFAVRPTGPSSFEATLPITLPGQRWIAPIRWLNQRIAAARLRQWLDTHAGARTLRVDEDHEYLIGWLGEDVPAVLDGSEADIPGSSGG